MDTTSLSHARTDTGTDRVPAAAVGSAVRHPLAVVRTRFHGAHITRRMVVVLAALTLVEVALTAWYWVAGATRPGYDWVQESISSLSLGPDGWASQLNSIVLGLVCVASALVWRRALGPGRSSLAYSITTCVAGVGLVAVGLFSQDPISTYPLGGAVLPHATLHALLHQIAAGIAVAALAASVFVLARRLFREAFWGLPWSAYLAGTGVATLALMVMFWSVQYSSDFAGMVERIAIILTLPAAGTVVVTRLLLQHWRRLA